MVLRVAGLKFIQCIFPFRKCVYLKINALHIDSLPVKCYVKSATYVI